MSTAALKVRDLKLWINSATGRQTLLDGISFDLKGGEMTALVGESGCGKTMTALAILGLLPAACTTDGASVIELNGKDITRLSQAQRRRLLGRDISMVFQQPGTALDPVFTLGQQISAVVRRHGTANRQASKQSMLEALTQVGFNQPDEIAAAYPHQLSGGMRQLAMIAMATICKPSVLIADEPTTALDINTRIFVLQQLKRLQVECGMAILLISHDLTMIRQSCEQVLVMYCGRLLETTDPANLFSQPRHPYSAGLLACIPQVSATRPAPIKAIPGQVPALAELPTGCHFAPRCERVVSQCRQSPPGLESENGSAVACYRPL